MREAFFLRFFLIKLATTWQDVLFIVHSRDSAFTMWKIQCTHSSSAITMKMMSWTSVMASATTCRDDLPYAPLQVKVANSLKTLLARMKTEEKEQVDGNASKKKEEEIGG